MVDETVLNGFGRRVNELEERVVKVESKQEFLDQLLKSNIDTNQKLASTLQDVKESIIKINDKMDSQVEQMNAVKRNLEDVNTKIQSVNSRIEKVDEKSKFDISEFFKKYFPWIVIMVGMGMYTLSKFVKF